MPFNWDGPETHSNELAGSFMAWRIKPKSFILYCIAIAAVIVVVAGSAWFDFDIKAMILDVLRNYHLIRPEEDPLKVPIAVARPDLPDSEGGKEQEYQRVLYERFAPYRISTQTRDEIVRATQDLLDAYSKTIAGSGVDLHKHADLLKRLQQGGQIAQEDWQAVRRDMAQLQPFVNTIERMAVYENLRPDMLWHADDANADTGELGARIVRLGVEALCLEGFERFERGHDRPAFKALGHATELLFTEPIAGKALQEAQVDGLETVRKSWSAMAQRTKNPLVLELSLQEMNQAATRVVNRTSAVFEPISRDLLSRIRATGQKDIIESIERTTPDYLLSLYRKAKERQIQVELARGQISEQQAQKARERFEVESGELTKRVQEFMEDQQQWATTDDAATSMRLSARKIEEFNALARFDLTRIEVARKVADSLSPNLDTRTTLLTLNPRYLPAPPIDPYSSDIYAIDAESGRVYSVGPDGTDQRGAILYDPTNGTKSAGDIFIEWKLPKP